MISNKVKKLLHVGCSVKTKESTTAVFNTSEWEEIRLDIDSSVKPDIVASILDMKEVKDNSIDAIFSSHNIEHLYPHEVEIAIKEFNRALNNEGYIIITCPDLQEICRLISEEKLTEPVYTSPAGPISPIDIIYGHRASIMRGNLFMAHKCGFTLKVLLGILKGCGFKSVGGYRRLHPSYDLWAVGTKSEISFEDVKKLLKSHSSIKHLK